jgi:hypothetical protein
MTSAPVRDRLGHHLVTPFRKRPRKTRAHKTGVPTLPGWGGLLSQPGKAAYRNR